MIGLDVLSSDARRPTETPDKVFEVSFTKNNLEVSKDGETIQSAFCEGENISIMREMKWTFSWLHF